MKNFKQAVAVVFYALAIICLGFYAYWSLNPNIYMTVLPRLIIIGIIVISAYVASLLLTKTANEETSHRIMKIMFSGFFILYIFLVITLVLFDSYFGRSEIDNLKIINPENAEYYFKYSFNIIPFNTILKYITGSAEFFSLRDFAINILGNIIAFMPFAFFLPLLFKKFKSFGKFLVAMIIIVLFVEIMQMVLVAGACDIDDLILNVGGACLAYAVFKTKPIKRLIEGFTKLEY